MITLNVSISESEYKMLGIKTDKLTFSDVVDLVSRQQIKKKLKKSIELAEKAGLSAMNMDEITEEVNAVRNAKNRR
jgi:hypothetical protein